MQRFRCHVLIYPARTVPGEWIGHCLDFDVVSQGRSPQHAFDMVGEATAMIVTEAIGEGRMPEPRRAPQRDWETFDHVMEYGDRVESAQALRESTPATIASLAELVVMALHQNEHANVTTAPRLPAPQMRPTPQRVFVQTAACA